MNRYRKYIVNLKNLVKTVMFRIHKEKIMRKTKKYLQKTTRHFAVTYN